MGILKFIKEYCIQDIHALIDATINKKLHTTIKKQTLPGPCGATSPRVGGIAKAMLYDVNEGERQSHNLN